MISDIKLDNSVIIDFIPKEYDAESDFLVYHDKGQTFVLVAHPNYPPLKVNLKDKTYKVLGVDVND